MKEYKANSSKVFFVAMAGIYLAVMAWEYWINEFSLRVAQIVGLALIPISILSALFGKAMSTDFNLGENEFKYRTGFDKNWKSLAYSDIREAKYSKLNRRAYLHVRTFKPYEEYNFILGIENQSEFLTELKSKLNDKYFEDTSIWKKVSNYLPS
jgi:hypothetical protein